MSQIVDRLRNFLLLHKQETPKPSSLLLRLLLFLFLFFSKIKPRNFKIIKNDKKKKVRIYTFLKKILMRLHFRSNLVGKNESGVVGLRTSRQVVDEDKYWSMSDLFLLILQEFRGRERSDINSGSCRRMSATTNSSSQKPSPRFFIFIIASRLLRQKF